MEHINWSGFKPGAWQNEINVRDFIQQNYTPYEGDDSFLAGATARTKDEKEGAEPGTVIEVFQKGYKLKDRLLRPAMVKVSE